MGGVHQFKAWTWGWKQTAWSVWLILVKLTVRLKSIASGHPFVTPCLFEKGRLWDSGHECQLDFPAAPDRGNLSCLEVVGSDLRIPSESQSLAAQAPKENTGPKSIAEHLCFRKLHCIPRRLQGYKTTRSNMRTRTPFQALRGGKKGFFWTVEYFHIFTPFSPWLDSNCVQVTNTAATSFSTWLPCDLQFKGKQLALATQSKGKTCWHSFDYLRAELRNWVARLVVEHQTHRSFHRGGRGTKFTCFNVDFWFINGPWIILSLFQKQIINGPQLILHLYGTDFQLFPFL